MASTEQNLETATFGAGCFWCVEAVFAKLEGVRSAVSGYMGGITENPSYQDVCTGLTKHAEVVQLTFDPQRIEYGELLNAFWQLHDPTTLNRQGADVGTQYRSVIFYHNEAQRTAAESSKEKLDASGQFRNPIVTEISPAQRFYQAEGYHQEFYEKNKEQQYCQLVIRPKLEKLQLHQ